MRRRRAVMRRPGAGAPNPAVSELYTAADRAAGAERRELYAMAAAINRAIADRKPREEIAALEQQAFSRLGLLLL